MYFSMGSMINLPQPSVKISVALQMLLAIAIIAIDFKFFTSGTKALIKRVPNMDTLVAMGSAISFLYSFVYTILLYMNKVDEHTHMFYAPLTRHSLRLWAPPTTPALPVLPTLPMLPKLPRLPAVLPTKSLLATPSTSL